MNFYLIGIDHNSASLEVREAVHKRVKEISGFLAGGLSGKNTMLSTCNRIEIYGITGSAEEAGYRVKSFLEYFPEFSRHGYAETQNRPVFRHIVRLSCGLESQIKGETQILEQLDSLYNAKSFPKGLLYFWDHAVTLGRYMRLEAGLNDSGRNIAAAIFDDIFKNVDHDNRVEVAVVGTGKVASLFALNARPEARISFLANKNHLKAKELAGLTGGEAFLLQDLASIAATRDVIISATKSPHFIIKNGFPAALARRTKPLHIYDLAMPRDIDPGIGRIKNVILKNSEDLACLFREYNKDIEDRLNLAEYLSEEAIKNNGENFDGTDIARRSAAKPIGNKAG